MQPQSPIDKTGAQYSSALGGQQLRFSDQQGRPPKWAYENKCYS